jgi:hypothetical protein
MRIDDYELINPRDTEAGDRLTSFAHVHPLAAERLVRALEEFVHADTDLSYKIVEDADIETYLVPPRYVLVHVPDAAALIRVNHASEQIDIVEIFEEYGGYDEPAQWQQVKDLALAAVEIAR